MKMTVSPKNLFTHKFDSRTAVISVPSEITLCTGKYIVCNTSDVNNNTKVDLTDASESESVYNFC